MPFLIITFKGQIKVTLKENQILCQIKIQTKNRIHITKLNRLYVFIHFNILINCNLYFLYSCYENIYTIDLQITQANQLN